MLQPQAPLDARGTRILRPEMDRTALQIKVAYPLSPGLAGGKRGRRTLRGQILHPGQGGLRL